MSIELKKRIATSIILIFLLWGMYFYSYVLIISLIIISIITWVEFYALISKIIEKNNFKDKFLRFLYKSGSLLYMSLLVCLIIFIETYSLDMKIHLIYSVFVAIMSDIGGLVIGKIFKGRKLSKISPNKTISGSIGSYIFSLMLIPFFYIELISYSLLMMI